MDNLWQFTFFMKTMAKMFGKKRNKRAALAFLGMRL